MTTLYIKIIRQFPLLLCFLASLSSSAFTLRFDGNEGQEIIVKPDPSTGLEALYVVNDISLVSSISLNLSDFEGFSGVQIYSNLGGGYAEDLPYSVDEDKIQIQNPPGNTGYILNTSRGNICFWIVDYSKYRFNIESVYPAENQPCDYTEFDFHGNGEPIKYFSITGKPCTLSREIKVKYTFLSWDSSVEDFVETEVVISFDSMEGKFITRPALNMATGISVSGDRFTSAWGDPSNATCYMPTPNGLEAITKAVQTNANNDTESNEIKSDGNLLGGSAPADFLFSAFVTPGIIHTEWQISEYPDFDIIKYRFTDKDLEYSFTEEGKDYIRFVGSNADGSCEVTGETYEVSIGKSELRIPNAFSPNGDGINDIWKVAFASLVKFKCWIFDRNGKQLFFFDNPREGWDGTHHGKKVAPGVYFYVIEALGADGVKYKKGGDINILDYHKFRDNTGN